MVGRARGCLPGRHAGRLSRPAAKPAAVSRQACRQALLGRCLAMPEVLPGRLPIEACWIEWYSHALHA
eukprot:360826-Chlamydomonas_euryale.AAC.1